MSCLLKKIIICIPAKDIDSVLKIDKKAFPQAYLEKCKYKLKKRKPVNFIDFEIMMMMMMMMMMIMITIVMTIMIMKIMIMKMILLHLNNHKNYDYF